MSMMKVYFQAITIYKNMLKHTEMWGTNPISAAHSMLHPRCKYKVNYVRRT